MQERNFLRAPAHSPRAPAPVPVQEYAAAGTRRCDIDIFRAGKKVERFGARQAYDDVRPRSPTSGATVTFFHLVRDDLETITLTSTISQRLVLCIRLIKPKLQRTVTPFQTSPSADKSLYVFNRIGIDKTETDWERNTGG